MNYYVYISKQEGIYVAEVPALPGCRTMGRTEEEAVENIRDVIEGYVHMLKKNHRPLPKVKVVKVSEGWSAKQHPEHAQRAQSLPVRQAGPPVKAGFASE